MKVGLMVPQGWKHEYDGWDTAAAWARSLELTRRAEALGFESLWVFDHFHTVEPDATDDPTWESFTMLAALAMVTSRVRLGHMVVCSAFRNPTLTAKVPSLCQFDELALHAVTVAARLGCPHSPGYE